MHIERAFFNQTNRCRPNRPPATPRNTSASIHLSIQFGPVSPQYCDQLQNGWTNMVGGTPRSQLQGVHELGPGSQLNSPGSGTSFRVDSSGNMEVSGGRSGTPQQRVHQLLGALQNALSSYAGETGSCSPCQSQHGASPASKFGLRMEPGAISTRNGRRVTYSTPGAIVRLPDGSSVGTGRNSGNSPKNIRQVVAGPGSQIPTSPPGATTVFQLTEQGELIRLGLDNEVRQQGNGATPQRGNRAPLGAPRTALGIA